MEAGQVEESLQALVVPLREMNIVVPQSMILEVIPTNEVQQVQGGDSWLRGFVEWRGAGIPLISMDRLCDPQPDDDNERTRRLAVMRSISQSLSLTAYALEIFSIPHPVKLKSADVLLTEENPECPYISVLTQAAGVQAAIVDFSTVEEKIAEVLPSAQAAGQQSTGPASVSHSDTEA